MSSDATWPASAPAWDAPAVETLLTMVNEIRIAQIRQYDLLLLLIRGQQDGDKIASAIVEKHRKGETYFPYATTEEGTEDGDG